MIHRLYLILVLLFPISAHAETVFKKEAIPEGFVIQILEPTGGKILRPKDWFYTGGCEGPSCAWVISKEDASKEPYETGVRIQTFFGVKKRTGKTPEEFVSDFYETKKLAVQEVHSTCSPATQGMFTRTCLEVNEGKYRILYSMFWANQLDIAVVSISGTLKENWADHKDTFDLMGVFEFIDIQRYEKEMQQEPAK